MEMGRRSSAGRVSSILVAAFLFLQQVTVIARNASAWLTLTGTLFLSSHPCITHRDVLCPLFPFFLFFDLLRNAPAIVAKGGFSGLFPDSSRDAYSFALIATCYYFAGSICHLMTWICPDLSYFMFSGKPLIISHNGASGDYPDCTDLSYQKAVDDGADFIDCPVQVTQDGIAICMSSIDLIVDTTVTKSPFASRLSSIPEIQNTPGIFTFNLTWDEIQKNLKPLISNPESTYQLVRNPRYANAGSFMRLSDFLAYAKDKPLGGALISIEYAAFIAEQLGFSVIDLVISALNDAGYNNQTALEVMILSTNSSVLVEFRQKTKFKLVYKIDESIRDAVASSIVEIKEFADAVAIDRQSVYPVTQQFTTSQTDIVPKLQNAGLAVYAYLFQNEFVAQPWDFFSDATVEINSYVQGAGVDGLITDFPATASAYKTRIECSYHFEFAGNSCRKMGKNAPSYMSPVQGGGLLQLVSSQSLPPALSPMPVLDVSDVVEPPLPPVAPRLALSPAVADTAPSPSQLSGELRLVSSLFVSLSLACVSLLLV
ncbi:hypothetical protein B296_00007110 [Ensete ventricosum]|uniref:glycerophosphodiester phosphodiesterase n=1 Tax=Ensete ventricosum TaxID=4639 RepID=A0A426YIN8_ENSVE|nr:hypothetical protein B296_00007110 [Ensete ventricosum]